MFPDRDFDMSAPVAPGEDALLQDLALSTLVDAMSAEDKFLRQVTKKALLTSLTEISAIRYRQHAVKDCLKNEEVIRKLYRLIIDTIERERKDFWWTSSHSPTVHLHQCVRILGMFLGVLRQLKKISDQEGGSFESEAFRTFFALLRTELGEEYLALLEYHLKRLEFPDGVLVSARLGEGNKARDFVLRKQPDPEGNWFTRLFVPEPPGYSFELPERDEAGAAALSELRERGINLVANAVGHAADHVKSFFKMLQQELAFYIGCVNLKNRLASHGCAFCFPDPTPLEERSASVEGLYDVCLALMMNRKVIANSLNAAGKGLIMITGANQGGKSTFLRSVGIAQLMMQCGMFVGATRMTANVCTQIFTHYKREEDSTMSSGKFDEELHRMSRIVDVIRPNSMVLFNESFASTNEREGSEIGYQIVSALCDRQMKILFVTHQYELAHRFENENREDALFLRAEREPNGERTFKVLEGAPLPTSFGIDLYRQIFAEGAGT